MLVKVNCVHLETDLILASHMILDGRELTKLNWNGVIQILGEVPEYRLTSS